MLPRVTGPHSRTAAGEAHSRHTKAVVPALVAGTHGSIRPIGHKAANSCWRDWAPGQALPELHTFAHSPACHFGQASEASASRGPGQVTSPSAQKPWTLGSEAEGDDESWGSAGTTDGAPPRMHAMV